MVGVEFLSFEKKKKKRRVIENLATKKLIKDKITARVDMPWRIFQIIAKI